MPGRSYETITKNDLRRLRELATQDRLGLFQRSADTARLYESALFAVALCQGAALHYLDGKNGVKDFDVWSFYRANPARPFPYRRRGVLDFGDPRFGTTDDSPQFVGRRVDLIGRSIVDTDYSDPTAVLRRYLVDQTTNSAFHLAQKAMILLEPEPLFGTVVWPA